MGINEVRWKGQRNFVNDGVRIIYSEGEKYQKGIAIMFGEEATKRKIEAEQCYSSDRLVMVKVRTMLVDMVIIQMYMPTTDHDDQEIEEIVEQIESIINKQKGNTNILVMRGFNATVGEGGDKKSD